MSRSLLVLLLLALLGTTCLPFARAQDDEEEADFEDEADKLVPVPEPVPEPVAPTTVDAVEVDASTPPVQQPGVDGDVDEDADLNIRTKPEAKEDKPKTISTPRSFNIKNYKWEMLAVAGLVAYLLNYLQGSKKNSRIAKRWEEASRDTMVQNFAVVGVSTNPQEGPIMIRESAHEYVWYGSGRRHCYSLSALLDLQQRHELFAVMSGKMKRETDSIFLAVEMDEKSMDNFIVAVCPRQKEKKTRLLFEELGSINQATNGTSYGLPEGLVVMADCREAAVHVLTADFVRLLREHANDLEYVLLTDSGRSQTEESDDKKLPPRKMILVRAELPGLERGEVAAAVGWLNAAIALTDRVGQLRLPPGTVSKARAGREKVSSQDSKKAAHAQRMQRAQEVKEERKRREREEAEKKGDKALQEWEEREQRKEMKKKGQRMKGMVVRVG
eukprot:m.38429 g.38429  ORF g.38429 m.38429 type:complete len:443 (+) comp13806_c0_seq2:69-1397(+)